ncbi:MFS transporter [bacterium]|nr:MFS transporter [bacterium]
MPTGLKVIFRSLRYRNYRLFFGGQSISLIGTWIQRIAVPWLVYDLTASTFLLGVVGFAGQITTFLLAPLAGVLTDRYNRYHILIATQVLATIQALILAFLFFIRALDVWYILFLSVLLGSINAFDIPARQSFVVEMVEKKEDLGNAIALNSSMVNGARLLGPSIAGILIALTGEGICFLINGLSYFVVIVALLKMKIVPRKIDKKNTHVFKELKEGFVYTFGFVPIKSVILLLTLVSLMGMPYSVLMPVFAKEILHGSSHTFGFLMGASGLGALIGAMYLASRKSVLMIGRMIPFAAAIFGVGLVAFSLSRLFILSFILMVITGLGMMLQMASSNTILQTIVDDDKRGRVMSFYTMAFIGTAPFGSLLAGGLASRFGVATTLIIGGISCIAGAIAFAGRLSELKKMVHPIYVKLGIVSQVAEGIQTATELTVPPEE